MADERHHPGRMTAAMAGFRGRSRLVAQTGRSRPVALAAIRTIHTAAFLVIAGSIVVTVVDGLRGRPSRRTAVAAAIALTECAVYAGNGFVCPLTPLAQELGAERGSVSDLFLPDPIARHLAWISSPVLVVGLVLDAAAWRRRRRP